MKTSNMFTEMSLLIVLGQSSCSDAALFSSYFINSKMHIVFIFDNSENRMHFVINEAESLKYLVSHVCAHMRA